MGMSISKLTSPVKQFITSRKRKLDYDIDSEHDMNVIINEALHTPKRKKLMRTAEYIFQTLYIEGKNSDVTVLALGKSFCLHKVYLCQSPYFASMFNGSWLESTRNFIPIEIVDSHITVESLNIVFGSLYMDEITLEPSGIVSVLATATLFQLEGIIEQCIEVMTETVNPKTSVQYYQAGCEYGVKKIKDLSLKWLQVNLLSYLSDHPKRLRKIPTRLLTDLIKSSELFVLQTEFSIYLMIRNWMFLKLNPSWMESDDTEVFCSYFSSRKDLTPFLLTKEGEKYIPAFRALRLKNLLLHHLDIEMIHKDNIIPKSWLNPEILQQWYTMLKVNQNIEKGPSQCNEEVFYKHCLRCGRVLSQEDKQMWRWTGFHFGLDLVVITDGHSMWIKRNHRSENEQMLSLQMQRYLLVKVTIAALNDQRQIKHIQTTGIKQISFTRNEEVPLLTFDKELTFPLLVSVNLLLTSPWETEKSSELKEKETKV